MRQYRIITQTPDTEQSLIEPGVHKALYNMDVIKESVKFITTHKYVEMIGIRIDARLYSIVVTHADELLDNHFELDA